MNVTVWFSVVQIYWIYYLNMGNQGSSPHEPLDRAQAAQPTDLKMVLII